ncbi:hypothetical protein SPBR_05999 [Sporothrix brasiliensis 5110]|uniref:Mitochondrial pyruvate carrier n=1 Tax=Sporothrix brasiliensis 5110 TaxID=1398154 RepID=A0A0C2J4R8_9PEZI|nr:uncharacterized protein SPBR_05999 [Sporothrix brasiliensis 5110]KIH94020.1 hypothetical protein SPBR_05999 [Sporothrix brasiliensis 5110]
MAAFIKAANAKIRSNPVTDYICSTLSHLGLGSSDADAACLCLSVLHTYGARVANAAVAKPAAYIWARPGTGMERATVDAFVEEHFWGPVSNFGIPIAAVMDTQKSPDLISGKMTFALVIYSATFMRYSLAVTPKNYLLFLCHFINEASQLTQGYRYMNYHHWGGKDAASSATSSVKGALEAAKSQAKAAEAKVEAAVKK